MGSEGISPLAESVMSLIENMEKVRSQNYVFQNVDTFCCAIFKKKKLHLPCALSIVMFLVAPVFPGYDRSGNDAFLSGYLTGRNEVRIVNAFCKCLCAILVRYKDGQITKLYLYCFF